MSQLDQSDNACWRLSGELSFSTVNGLLKQFKGSQPAMLDLSAVTRTDSAGVAFLLELLKLTDEQIRFREIPQQMHRIASVSGVEEFLAKHEQ